MGECVTTKERERLEKLMLSPIRTVMEPVENDSLKSLKLENKLLKEAIKNQKR